MTFRMTSLIAIVTLSVAGSASANEAFVADNLVTSAPTRINQILAEQSQIDRPSSEARVSRPVQAFPTAQLNRHLNTGPQSAEDIVSILLSVQQQRIAVAN